MNIRSGCFWVRHSLASSLTACLIAACFTCRALTILSGPSFTPSTNAPLAGTLRLTTDTDSRISVSVTDGIDSWTHNFYDYGTTHSAPLLGFKPDRTNHITVTVYGPHRHAVTVPEPLEFVTTPLPTNFPNLHVLVDHPGKMEPGYILFNVAMHNQQYWYVTIVDNAGQVVWYDAAPSTADVRQLDNGDLFMPWTTNFYEIDMLGNIAKSWVVPANLPIDLHDGVPTDHGTILYLSDQLESVTNFPTSATNPNAPRTTAQALYQKVVEISQTNAAVLHTWSPIDLLDPTRISYLFDPWEGGWDVEHSNAIREDPNDNSLLISMRHQNAVVKFTRNGQLKWILGTHANWGPAWQPYLLNPVGTNFEWQYGQHSAIVTPQGTLMMYDDGNFRASPFDAPVADSNNWSRAVEYKVNEQTMEVSQVWEYGRTNGDRLYTGYEGSAYPEPKTGNVLIGFPSVSYENGVPPSTDGPRAVSARIKEVTHDAAPQVLFDLAITMYDKTNSPVNNCTIYRARRIADIYPHPVKAVSDLVVNDTNGTPSLAFSADDALSYTVQASTNLVDWETIGTPTEEPPGTGDFSFEDGQSAGMQARYYRVVTQAPPVYPSF
jgi:arylsulfate sulfotransferase